MSSNGKPLRFAALIRVSTEKQERQGESLRTQRKQIEETVARLGGKIVQRYAGQEHATAGWEREQRDKMLAEAEKDRKPFDAVMVAHEDRWSRDDTRSGSDLERLKKAGVRFFVLDREQDLHDPTARMYLGMSAVIGAYHARNQKKKSLENRIERARRGVPVCGRLPTGRTYDEATGKWGIDEDRQRMIADVAARYLAGELLPTLATEYNTSLTNLYDTLKDRCGETWMQEFDCPDLNISERIVTRVPRLLPEATIRAVNQRLEANRTYLHRPPTSKHAYLLRGRIFCAECGYVLTGQEAHPSGRLYYRHPHRNRERACPLRPRPWVPAHEIEGEVVKQLFNMFGSPAAIERAVKAAVPDCGKALERRQRLEAELGKIDRARNRVLDLIEKDALTDDQAEAKLHELKARESSLRVDLDKLVTTLADVPDAEQLRCYIERIEDALGTATVVVDDEGNMCEGGNDVQTFMRMTDADRRSLIRCVFDTPLANGTPAGIYVRQDGEGKPWRHKKWAFRIRGRLGFKLVMQNAVR